MRKFEFQNKNHSASGRPVDWGTCMWVGICVDTETGASGAHSSKRRGQCGFGDGSGGEMDGSERDLEGKTEIVKHLLQI